MIQVKKMGNEISSTCLYGTFNQKTHLDGVAHDCRTFRRTFRTIATDRSLGMTYDSNYSLG